MYKDYILKSLKDGSYYVGCTVADVGKRLEQHNNHCNSYSASKSPFELVWHCCFLEKSKAMTFEKYLKQGSGFAFRNKHLI